MKYHEFVWTLQETADRWPATCLYVVLWPLLLSIVELLGGRLW